MGLIRGSLLFFAGFLLLISLIVGNVFLMLNFSLGYNNVAPYIKNTTQTMAVNSGAGGTLLQNYENQKILCTNQNFINLSFEGETYNISCDTVNQGAKYVIDNIINKTAQKAYYKSYNCSLLNCPANETSPIMFVSKYAKDYWNSKFQTLILISLGLFILVFLFTKQKKNAFIITGILMILSAIPFREVSLLSKTISNFFPFKIVPLFFSGANNVFWIMLIIGIVFLAGGIGLSIIKLGEKATKFVKPIVKKMKKDEEEVEEEEKPVTEKEVKRIVKKEMEEEEYKEKSSKKKSKKK